MSTQVIPEMLHQPRWNLPNQWHKIIIEATGMYWDTENHNKQGGGGGGGAGGRIGVGMG